MVRLVIILSLLGNICYADDVIYLEKDQKAPYNGFLFTEERTRDTRIKLLERDTYKGLSESLDKTNSYLQQNSELKDKQIQIMMDRNDQLAKALKEERTTSNWERILYVGLGILGTGLAIKLAHDTYR